VLPGVCIMLMVLFGNLLGDWLRVEAWIRSSGSCEPETG